jgi:hypothetical protein
VCIGTDKKGVHIHLYYRPISTYDYPIIPIVLATLNVIIERANLGTNKKGGSPFYWREDTLLPSYVHHIL